MGRYVAAATKGTIKTRTAMAGDCHFGVGMGDQRPGFNPVNRSRPAKCGDGKDMLVARVRQHDPQAAPVHHGQHQSQIQAFEKP